MIDFLNLKKTNDVYRKEINTRIKIFLNSGQYILGEENKIFEKLFAKYCGVKHCIACANGFDALKLIIKAYGFTKKDEIIVQANTYIASILAISENSCKPVLVEPDINTYNSDTNLITELPLPISSALTEVETKKIVEALNVWG